MYENAQMPKVAVEFSRRREQEASISRMFVRLIVLDYKRAGQRSEISCAFPDRRIISLTNKD